MNNVNGMKHTRKNTPSNTSACAGTATKQLPRATVVRDSPLAAAIDVEEMLQEWMFATMHLPEALACGEEAGLFENLMPPDLQDVPVLVLRLPPPVQLRLAELAVTDIEIENEALADSLGSTTCAVLRVPGLCVSYPATVLESMPLDDGSDVCVFTLMLIAGGRIVIAERRVAKSALLADLQAAEMLSDFSYRIFRSGNGQDIGGACEEAWLGRETIKIRLAMGKAEDGVRDDLCLGQDALN